MHSGSLLNNLKSVGTQTICKIKKKVYTKNVELYLLCYYVQ